MLITEFSKPMYLPGFTPFTANVHYITAPSENGNAQVNHLRMVLKYST